MRSLRSLAGLAAAAALLLAPAPAEAGPRSNARYDGATPGDRRNHLVVSRAGDKLKRYFFVVAAPCSDGRRRTFGIVRGGSDRGIPIDAQGAFAYRRRPQTIPAHRTRGLFRFRVSGAFSPNGEQVSATIAVSFASRRFDCASGEVPFTLHLDGTPGAPFVTGTVATRRYAATGPHARLMLRPFVPGREISWARVRWAARCRDGGRITGLDRRFTFYLRPDDTFAIRRRQRVPLRGGGVSRERTSLTGRFFRDASGAYVVQGVWRILARVSSGGRTTRCSLTAPFRGAAL